MNWDAISAISELIGALAVLTTMIPHRWRLM